MSISVKLEAFEGPLDLLLHLIDKNKVNIHDIPIAIITEQYMEYIRQMETKNLDVMSEFLVMAATLINIKSKMLLPKDETKEEEEDPRQELVERLLEYKMYKYISIDLKDREMDAAKILYKIATIPKEIEDFKEEIDPKSLLSDLTLAKLHKIFESVMKKQVDKIDPIRSKFGKIEKEEINLSEKIIAIQKYGLLHKTFSFRGLLMKQAGKMDVIVTFLGVLELIKIGQVIIKQENLFDDIMVTFTGNKITELDDNLVLN
ncbi:segregation/condensation protein A [Anaerocolumna sedimenticola]|uniref:Segregation and condensation protein A n=1 Tax=Anaerocolumna sedimenticola TaxID=2696063 RepID=A0A6P1TQ98_9FIRM|nr:segregation/condensation protein A [Anaerocolumna sedimenticola]QHQ62399.1 segregation/condensation protein A [Anaerocolumna sedimenticola]